MVFVQFKVCRKDYLQMELIIHKLEWKIYHSYDYLMLEPCNGYGVMNFGFYRKGSILKDLFEKARRAHNDQQQASGPI